jgi:hypothetical protein
VQLCHVFARARVGASSATHRSSIPRFQEGTRRTTEKDHEVADNLSKLRFRRFPITVVIRSLPNYVLHQKLHERLVVLVHNGSAMARGGHATNVHVLGFSTRLNLVHLPDTLQPTAPARGYPSLFDTVQTILHGVPGCRTQSGAGQATRHIIIHSSRLSAAQQTRTRYSYYAYHGHPVTHIC